MSGFVLKLTEEQHTDLTVELNCLLRRCGPVGDGLAVRHANRMNDLFKQLTGENHHKWEEFGYARRAVSAEPAQRMRAAQHNAFPKGRW